MCESARQEGSFGLDKMPYTVVGHIITTPRMPGHSLTTMEREADHGSFVYHHQHLHCHKAWMASGQSVFRAFEILFPDLCAS